MEYCIINSSFNGTKTYNLSIFNKYIDVKEMFIRLYKNSFICEIQFFLYTYINLKFCNPRLNCTEIILFYDQIKTLFDHEYITILILVV